MVLVDLDWAQLGYLLLPDGCLRYIPGLEIIARDTLVAAVTVWWVQLPKTWAGFADWQRHTIYLAAWTGYCRPPFLKRVWTEELAHCMKGPNEQRARVWQWWRYGPLIEPPDWEA